MTEATSEALKERARDLLMRLDKLLGKPVNTGPMAEQAFNMIVEALALAPTPSASGEREAIARIIDPKAWEWPCPRGQWRDESLAKADAILARPKVSGEAEVGQADREAASNMNVPIIFDAERGSVLAGKADDNRYVQAFRDHRLATLSAPAAVDATHCHCSQMFGLHHNIACPLSGRVTSDNYIKPTEKAGEPGEAS